MNAAWEIIMRLARKYKLVSIEYISASNAYAVSVVDGRDMRIVFKGESQDIAAQMQLVEFAEYRKNIAEGRYIETSNLSTEVSSEKTQNIA